MVYAEEDLYEIDLLNRSIGSWTPESVSNAPCHWTDKPPGPEFVTWGIAKWGPSTPGSLDRRCTWPDVLYFIPKLSYGAGLNPLLLDLTIAVRVRYFVELYRPGGYEQHQNRRLLALSRGRISDLAFQGMIVTDVKLGILVYQAEPSSRNTVDRSKSPWRHPIREFSFT